MLKAIRYLSQRKRFIVLVLSAPLLGVFFRTRFHFECLPENPNPRFQVQFSVPHRIAAEIETRVTEVAEKHFNGLPDLISMESVTSDHQATLTLIFRKTMTAHKAHLLVQEKLDQIKLAIPRDVETIRVERIKPARPADLGFRFKEPVAVTHIRDLLSPVSSVFGRTIPPLNQGIILKIVPDPVRLAREQLALTDLVEALKVSGMSTDLGTQSGILFAVGRAYDSALQLEATVVGARGARPVTLREVANISVETPGKTNHLEIWFDSNASSPKEITRLLRSLSVPYTVERPYFRSLTRLSLKPVVGILCVVFLQLVFFRLGFGKGLRLFTLPIFDGLISIHYIFWRGLFSGGLTILDLHALCLTLIVGTIFWILLFARIRTHLMPQVHLIKFPLPIEQATLFSLGELLPSFILLSVALWLFDLPILLSHVSTPGTFLLSGFFSTGLPVLLCILVFMPILTDYEWIKPSSLKVSRPRHWNSKRNTDRIALALLILGIPASIVTLHFFPLSVVREFDQSMKMFRGHGANFTYLAPESEIPRFSKDGMQSHELNERAAYLFWEFTPLGLRRLPSVKLSNFEPAVKQLESSEAFGFLGERHIPLKFGGLGAEHGDFGNLLLAPKDPNDKPMPIRLLASVDLRMQSSRILRNRMIRSDQVTLPAKYHRNDLKKTPSKEYLPTQWTQYLLAGITRFNRTHLVAMVFFLLLLSFYLNHFLRAGMLVMYALTMTTLVLFAYVWIGDFHIDSLWLLYFPPWLGLLGYIVISRVIDVERSRGYDRDLVVKEVRLQFVPSVVMALGFALASLFCLGLLEWIPRPPGLGLWHEAVFLSLLGTVQGWLLFRYLFPVIYLKSEATLDRLATLFIRLPWIGRIIRRLV